ncbi:MAG: cupredoxin domain-containing protein, partial [Actinomycetota bacterium]
LAATAGGRSELDVLALDDLFLPSIASIPRGGTVVWSFADAERSHTVTDSSGMGLFDSGIVAPGGPSMSYRFTAAGTYPYTCTLHALEMNGRVQVPISATPATGLPGRAFRVRWATSPAADGFAYEVQIKRRKGPWSPWASNVSAPKAEFVPRAVGTFEFRARLVALSAGHSQWSEPDSIRVT